MSSSVHVAVSCLCFACVCVSYNVVFFFVCLYYMYVFAAFGVINGYNIRVTTHLENLEKSGNSKLIREESGKMEKVWKSQGNS